MDGIEDCFVISCKEFVIDVDGYDDDGSPSREYEYQVVSMGLAKAKVDQEVM